MTSTSGGSLFDARRRLLERRPWLVFVLPFVVYMLAGSLEPSPPREGATPALSVGYDWYPQLYMLKIGLTAAAMAFVLPGYRQFPFRLTLWAVVIGVLGIFVWVGLWKLGLDRKLLELVGLGSLMDFASRPAFDPFQRLGDSPVWRYSFLAVRFLGLVVIVPVIEELFLRGFLMRLVMADDWTKVPFGKVNAAAVAVSLAWPVLTHPAEMLPAIVWFGIVTWLMVTTRNLWDCVVAHSLTNLLLGIYVVTWQEWALW